MWRHDIDYSLERSVALAKEEFGLGIKATYFLNIHSDFYNTFSAREKALIDQIIGYGHEIGVHFDASFYNINSEKELSDYIKYEAMILENAFKTKPTAFSFHNPKKADLVFENEEYAGLINCYSKKFKTEAVYCSDSNGYWRYSSISKVLEENKNRSVQALTHPGWWVEKPSAPRERIYHITASRMANTMNDYDSQLERDSRLNLSSVPEYIFKLKNLISMNLT